MKRREHTIFSLDNNLKQEHIDFFQKNGFIQFKKFIDRQTVLLLLEEIENVQQFLIKNSFKKVNGIPLKFGLDENNSLFIQRLAFTSQYSKPLSDFLNRDKFKILLQLLNPYEGRIGENEKDGLVVNHYINTPSSRFNKLGWHTDSPRDLFLGSRILPMLNVGLHLDDCAFENGGLRVLPGTHQQNIFRLLFRKKYFIDNKPDKKEIGFDINAGDLTVHDGRLWHRVQQSPVTGEASRRRVMYIPIITGAYVPKHANSATPFYHKLGQLKLNSDKKKANWALLKN
jgi:phytanoyl-CoA hydroxylase